MPSARLRAVPHDQDQIGLSTLFDDRAIVHEGARAYRDGVSLTCCEDLRLWAWEAGAEIY